MADTVSPVTSASNAGTETSKYYKSITLSAWARTHKGSVLVEAAVTKNKEGLGSGEWRPAEVNWAAYGSVEPVVALALAKVLSKAYLVAKRLDKEFVDEPDIDLKKYRGES